MAQLPKTLRNMTAFVDGRGYLGKVNSVELPKLTIKTREYRSGGMDVPVEIDTGMEKMEATLAFPEFDREVVGLWGLTEGKDVPITVRGVQTNGQDSEAVVAHLRGTIRTIDPGSWSVGEDAEFKIEMALRYYKLEIGGREVVEIDALNMVRRINRVDILAGQRRALGI